MRSLLVKILFTAVLLALALPAAAGDIEEKVNAALAAESRPAADAERDRNRRALQTLQFFGLEDDMRVLELLPGGGWYTRILAPVLAENGQLYLAMGTGRVQESVLTAGSPSRRCFRKKAAPSCHGSRKVKIQILANHIRA